MKLGRIVVIFVILLLISLVFLEIFCQCRANLAYKSKSHICLVCRIKKLIGILQGGLRITFPLCLLLKQKFSILRDGSLHVFGRKFPVLLKVRMDQ